MEAEVEKGVHRAVPGADLVLPHLHRPLYPQNLPLRAVLLDLRHPGFQEMGTRQRPVPHNLENPPLQPLGRQRL